MDLWKLDYRLDLDYNLDPTGTSDCVSSLQPHLRCLFYIFQLIFAMVC